MPTAPPTPSPSPAPHHGLPRHAVTAFVALFLLIFIFGGVALFRGTAQHTPQPSPTGVQSETPRSFEPIVTGAESPTLTPRPLTRKHKYIYTLESAGPRKVGDLIIRQSESTQSQLRMDDNGVIYYLESGNVYSYSLATQEKQLLYSNTDPNALVLDAIMSRTGKLYVTLQDTSATDGLPHYSVVEDTLSAGKTRLIGPLSPSVYGAVKYMFNTDYGDVLVSTGKEDCATYGVIIKIKDQPKELTLIGDGCAEYPKMVGYNADIFTVYTAKPLKDTYPETQYTSLDSLNVISEQTMQEYDLTTLGDPVRQVLMEGQTAVFMTDAYATMYDVEQKSGGAKISVPKPADYTWVLSGNMLYGSPIKDGPDIAVDMHTGSVRNIVLDDMKGSAYTLMYLGVWKKRPVFYVDATE